MLRYLLRRWLGIDRELYELTNQFYMNNISINELRTRLQTHTMQIAELQIKVDPSAKPYEVR